MALVLCEDTGALSCDLCNINNPYHISLTPKSAGVMNIYPETLLQLKGSSPKKTATIAKFITSFFQPKLSHFFRVILSIKYRSPAENKKHSEMGLWT